MFRQYLKLSLFILPLLAGCYSSYYILDNGGKRPSNPKFSLKGKKLPIEVYNLIDTNAIYLSTYKGYDIGGGDLFRAVRFFSNGRVYMTYACESEEEMTKQLNNPQTTGTIGYFSYEGGKIVSEFFLFETYVKIKYEFTKEGLVVKSSRTRFRQKFSSGAELEKIPKKKLKGNYNW